MVMAHTIAMYTAIAVEVPNCWSSAVAMIGARAPPKIEPPWYPREARVAHPGGEELRVEGRLRAVHRAKEHLAHDESDHDKQK
jgi:arginase family enzyme